MTPLSAVAARHDAFLVDQYGVLHDGARAFAGAIDALRRLAADGRRVAVLSNSGKRAGANADRLARLGFPVALIDAFVTSGEVAWRMLRDRALPPPFGAAETVFLVGRGGDAAAALDGVDLRRVERPEEAGLVLIAGSEGDARPLDHYRALLGRAAAEGTPCLCSNPDTTMVVACGTAFGAGVIADLYETMGGPVLRVGKPHRAIYDAALAALGVVPSDRVVGIGDSLQHDVAGANAAGLASALVRGGVNAALGDEALAELMAGPGPTPHYVLDGFRW